MGNEFVVPFCDGFRIIMREIIQSSPFWTLHHSPIQPDPTKNIMNGGVEQGSTAPLREPLLD